MTPVSDDKTDDTAVVELINASRVHTQSLQEANHDVKQRSKLVEMARSIYLSLQTPLETAFTSLLSINMAMPIRVGIDMGLFSALASSENPMTAAQLSVSTRGEELFIDRLMRCICTQNFAVEVDVNTYRANGVTRLIANPLGEAAYGIFYEPAPSQRAI